MAGTQTNQLKNSLFPPSLFDDPDTISQIAQVEAPQTPALTPGDQANVPMGGVVPKTFLDWHADPANVAKVAQPIPPNTPMPSVVAAKVQSVAQPSSDVTPPFSPDVAGSPEAQLYGTPAPQAAEVPQTSGPGLMKNAPSLEDYLMIGAPAQQQSQSQTQPQTPSGPLSKADFLAQNPAKIPNAPYVPHGGKLALTGLFAALDNAGAFLDHGTTTVGPGLMKNVQALQEYNQNLPANTAQAQQAAYDEYLKNYTSSRQNTLVPITVKGPDGQPMTTYVDPATQKSLLPAQIKAGGTVQAAQIGAQSRMDVKQLELSIQQGQISKMVPGINPATNQPQYEAFNKAGKSLGFIDHSVVPGLIARTSSTVEYKEDGDGNLHALPKTTVSAPSLPGNTRQPLTPPAVSPRPAAAPVPPVSGSGAPVAPPSPGSSPAAQSGGGKIVPGFLGKSAKETGVAYDPKSNQYFVTTRNEAANSGFQNFTKSTSAQIDNDRQLNNRLADVQQKMDRYQGTFSSDLSDRDKADLSALISDDHFKLPFGIELPSGTIGKIMSTNIFQNMSPQAQQRFIAFANARESMSGYQRVLTGSSRGNEKTLQLQLDTLASPLWQPTQAKEAFNQFGENLRIAGQGLPRMPGVQTADDVKNKNASGTQTATPQKHGGFDWNAHPKVQ